MLEGTAESDLSKVAPETLLQSLSVTGNFLEILQEFQEFSIQEIPLIIVSQAYKSRRYVCDGGMIFLLSFDYNFLEFLGVKCLSPGKLGVNEGVDCQNLFLSFLSFAFCTALLCNYYPTLQ